MKIKMFFKLALRAIKVFWFTKILRRKLDIVFYELPGMGVFNQDAVNKYNIECEEGDRPGEVKVKFRLFPLFKIRKKRIYNDICR